MAVVQVRFSALMCVNATERARAGKQFVSSMTQQLHLFAFLRLNIILWQQIWLERYGFVTFRVLCSFGDWQVLILVLRVDACSLGAALWNWAVVPYMGPLQIHLFINHKVLSALLIYHLFKQLLQLADKTVGPENSKVCETVQRSSQWVCYSPFVCKWGGRTSYSRWVHFFPLYL